MIDVLDDKVLALWIVTANHDPEQTYVFTDPEKVISSVTSGIRAYLDPREEMPDTEDHIDSFLRTLTGLWDEPYIPFQIYGLVMTIHRMELDRHNPLHAVLREAYDVLDIEGLGADGRLAEVRGV